MLKAWLSAFRLRTLPLALASIGMGSFLAADQQSFNLPVFILASLTTIFLQILSNLANDYGDSIHGADHAGRKGPNRAVQSGKISKTAMQIAMGIFVVLSLASGILLLIQAIDSWQTFLFFLGLGLLSILAAITYTAGKKPYGYMGLGDISVLIFFGWVAVAGTYYLHTHSFDWALLLPASSCGLFAVAVLNVNNIRDIESDKVAGKKSIPVRLGIQKAKIYHYCLLSIGFALTLVYTFLYFHHWGQLLFLVSGPLLLLNAMGIARKTEPSEIDPFLKQMVLSTLLFVLTFGIGLLI